MNLLDRMREEVTAPLRIVGLKGKKEVQLIDDACLKSLRNMVLDEVRKSLGKSYEIKPTQYHIAAGIIGKLKTPTEEVDNEKP